MLPSGDIVISPPPPPPPPRPPPPPMRRIVFWSVPSQRIETSVAAFGEVDVRRIATSRSAAGRSSRSARSASPRRRSPAATRARRRPPAAGGRSIFAQILAHVARPATDDDAPAVERVRRLFVVGRLRASACSGRPEPSARTRETVPPSMSFHVTYAMYCPSGDHAGWNSPTLSSAARGAAASRSADPSIHSRSSAVNASRLPSGDGGDVANLADRQRRVVERILALFAGRRSSCRRRP